jgi:hypothetical protein
MELSSPPCMMIWCFSKYACILLTCVFMCNLQVMYFPPSEEIADLSGMVRDTIRLSQSSKVIVVQHGSSFFLPCCRCEFCVFKLIHGDEIKMVAISILSL